MALLFFTQIMQMGSVPVPVAEEDRTPMMGATGPIVFVPEPVSKKKTVTTPPTPPIPPPPPPTPPAQQAQPATPARPGLWTNKVLVKVIV